LLVPLVGVAVAVVAAGLVRPLLSPWRPARCSRSLGVAVGWALVLIAFGWATTIAAVRQVAGWCDLMQPEHHVESPVLAVAAATLLAVGAVRAGVAWHRYPRLDRRWSGDVPVDVVASPQAIAFAVPGRPGTIVVSDAMLDLLDGPERAAVLAHEQAHLRHHHHRHPRATRAAVIILPLLAPLEAWVVHASERWADDEAVARVGDPTVVARALARVAATSLAPAPGSALAFGATGVAARITALREPRRPTSGVALVGLTVVGLAVFTTLVSSTVQFHHLVAFADHVCSNQ
jgi:Zn-dependent protease with chaperone function